MKELETVTLYDYNVLSYMTDDGEQLFRCQDVLDIYNSRNNDGNEKIFKEWLRINTEYIIMMQKLNECEDIENEVFSVANSVGVFSYTHGNVTDNLDRDGQYLNVHNVIEYFNGNNDIRGYYVCEEILNLVLLWCDKYFALATARLLKKLRNSGSTYLECELEEVKTKLDKVVNSVKKITSGSYMKEGVSNSTIYIEKIDSNKIKLINFDRERNKPALRRYQTALDNDHIDINELGHKPKQSEYNIIFKKNLACASDFKRLLKSAICENFDDDVAICHDTITFSKNITDRTVWKIRTIAKNICDDFFTLDISE